MIEAGCESEREPLVGSDDAGDDCEEANKRWRWNAEQKPISENTGRENDAEVSGKQKTMPKAAD